MTATKPMFSTEIPNSAPAEGNSAAGDSKMT